MKCYRTATLLHTERVTGMKVCNRWIWRQRGDENTALSACGWVYRYIEASDKNVILASKCWKGFVLYVCVYIHTRTSRVHTAVNGFLLPDKSDRFWSNNRWKAIYTRTHKSCIDCSFRDIIQSRMPHEDWDFLLLLSPWPRRGPLSLLLFSLVFFLSRELF